MILDENSLFNSEFILKDSKSKNRYKKEVNKTENGQIDNIPQLVFSNDNNYHPIEPPRADFNRKNSKTKTKPIQNPNELAKVIVVCYKCGVPIDCISCNNINCDFYYFVLHIACQYQFSFLSIFTGFSSNGSFSKYLDSGDLLL